MINLLCIPSLFKIVYWVAMEMVRFHITQTVFLSSGQNISHLVGPCEQSGTYEKLSWKWGARLI